jgi:hypothetical protein
MNSPKSQSQGISQYDVLIMYMLIGAGKSFQFKTPPGFFLIGTCHLSNQTFYTDCYCLDLPLWEYDAPMHWH